MPASPGRPASQRSEQLFDSLAPIVAAMRSDAAPRTAELETRLTAQIYSGCHGRQSELGGGATTDGRHPAATREFVARLSSVNSGIGPEQKCLVLPGDAADRMAVQWAGVTLWVDAQPDAVPGTQALVRFPKEYRALYPGHYVAIGDADRGEGGDTLRVYWNVAAGAAEALVRIVTRSFNAAGVPFRLKLPSNPASYTRADAAILYLPRTHRREGAALVTEEVWREMRPFLRPQTSAFVLTLAPGLGLAEDPPDGSSFGLHRSGLLAQLLCDAMESAEPLTGLAAALEAKGYDPGYFYRNPGSAETYDEFRPDEA